MNNNVDNEYDYNFEEDGIGTRGCVSLIIVLLLVLLLLGGVFWWWKNYFQDEDLNKSKVVVEIDDAEDYVITEDGTIVVGNDTDSNTTDDDNDGVAGDDEDSDVKVIVKETKVDAKGKERDYTKLSKDLSEEYSSDDYIFNYAEGWAISQPSKGFKVLTLGRKDAKLEIFKMDDFGGERNISLKGNETSAYVDANVPKEVYKIEGEDETYSIWVYYPAGDDESKEALEDVIDSFDLN